MLKINNKWWHVETESDINGFRVEINWIEYIRTWFIRDDVWDKLRIQSYVVVEGEQLFLEDVYMPVWWSTEDMNSLMSILKRNALI